MEGIDKVEDFLLPFLLSGGMKVRIRVTSRLGLNPAWSLMAAYHEEAIQGGVLSGRKAENENRWSGQRV